MLAPKTSKLGLRPSLPVFKFCKYILVWYIKNFLKTSSLCKTVGSARGVYLGHGLIFIYSLIKTTTANSTRGSNILILNKDQIQTNKLPRPRQRLDQHQFQDQHDTIRESDIFTFSKKLLDLFKGDCPYMFLWIFPVLIL